MVFHWRLSDSKSPKVSRTPLSILAVFNNAVVWMVYTRPPTSKSSRPFNNPLFFSLNIIKSGLLVEIPRWFVCISKSHRSLCVSFSRTGAGLCIYHLLTRSNLNFLPISHWNTLPTQLCLTLYFFCANLLHCLLCHWWFHLCHRIVYICYYYFTTLSDFHTSVSWWFSNRVSLTASLHKFPGLFSVFWPTSITL